MKNEETAAEEAAFATQNATGDLGLHVKTNRVAPRETQYRAGKNAPSLEKVEAMCVFRNVNGGLEMIVPWTASSPQE